MSSPAIRVSNLSKRYTLGLTHSGSIRDLVDRATDRLLGRRHSVPVSSPLGRISHDRTSDSFWALRDVSFEVQSGDVLGIIGRNGAGKSTLLKTLSRITTPTGGRIEINGRVASLLEVGTGFHPELTGRENIFLNGAILGMRKAEIRRKFDEIVAFAEVEDFIDTPVKRYSSGMYVRLAFAVAAHLDPEILIVDEVLAVGDTEFQKRCLGRMSSVARSGRTVLFVSHSMSAIENLCPRTLLLNEGLVEYLGPTSEVVSHYLSDRNGAQSWDLENTADRDGSGTARLTRLELLSADGTEQIESVAFRKPFRVRLHYRTAQRLEDPRIGLAVLSEKDERVFLTETSESNCTIPVMDGSGYVDCEVRSPNLLPGLYRLEAWIADIPNVRFADHVRFVGRLQVILGETRMPGSSRLLARGRGYVFFHCDWNHPVSK
jgi:lipopolysaccharide transport system ATP-binding protein